jgi:RNA polymerase sigma-70 factor (ECF subfamily)
MEQPLKTNDTLSHDVSSKKYLELTALFLAGLEGNNVAYRQFLEKISRFLRVIVARKIAGDEGEDVVQEILISLHKARHTYEPERPLIPWVLAIAQFRINDFLRKMYHQEDRHYLDVYELEEILADNVTKTIDEYESIDEILQNLSAKEQEILQLLYVQEHTAKETGVLLNMSESAVKVAAHRAIKKLRDSFSSG